MHVMYLPMEGITNDKQYPLLPLVWIATYVSYKIRAMYISDYTLLKEIIAKHELGKKRDRTEGFEVKKV